MSPPLSGAQLYKRLLAYARPGRRVFVAAAVAMLLFAATDTGFAALMKPMLDGNFVERNPDTIRFVPLALIALFVFRGITAFISRYSMSWIGRRVIKDLRRDIFHQLLRLPAGYYDRNPSGQLLSKLTFDVEQVAEATTNAVTILIRDSLTLVFLLAYMFWISGWLTLLFLVIGPLLVWLIRHVSRRFRRLSRRIQDSMGALTQFSNEVIHAQVLVKSFNGEAYQEAQFARVNEDNRRLHLKMAAVQGASTPIVQLLAASILALLIYLATLESLRQEISVGTFVSFIAAMMLLMQPLKRLTNVNASIQRGLAAGTSIFALLDEEVEKDNGRMPLTHASGAIEFRKVSFTYASRQEAALRDLSFSIQPGQTIALAGRSGSGKSTLAHLLIRLYDPLQGSIQIDGQDIRDYRLADLRSQIAMVGQDVVLFNDTVGRNIAYGCPGRCSEERIVASAGAAHAMEFINRLPQGLQTRIGDQGVMLSGGQRQRLAIARAILKDAPILILDEATSALDSESEALVQDALERLAKGRTSIIIAHRLSTLERADRILVLENGRLVESGQHAELLSRQGRYADLYQLQFRNPA